MQKKKETSWQEMVWGFSVFDAHIHLNSILFSFSIFLPDQLPSFVEDPLTNHSTFFPCPIPDLISIQISSYSHSHFYFFLKHHYYWNSMDSFPYFSSLLVMTVFKQLKLILLLLSFQFPLYFLSPCSGSGDGNILILSWSKSTALIPNCQDTDFK